MLATLLLCTLANQTSRAGQEERPAPSAEEVARATASLDAAFRSGEAKRIQAALEAAQAFAHASVVRGTLRGLEDERPEVRLAVLQALRRLDHPDALEALHRAAKDRRLMKPPELALAVLRGIGQHADPRSIAVLARDPFEPDDPWCLRARLFGLARIRTPDALEAVLGILATTGAGGQRRLHAGRMGDARLALMVLTGVDQGREPEPWERWWRDNQETFRLPSEAPTLPKELRADWDAFWGLPQRYERLPRREDRGRDPPPPED
jgi:hypothetical protein